MRTGPTAAHPSRDEVEAYVMGALEPASGAGLEEHVVTCVPCARLLAAEARRELALADAMIQLDEAPLPRPHHARSPSWSSRLSSAIAPVAVAAAAVWLLLAGPAPQLLPVTAEEDTGAESASLSGSPPLLACLLDGEALCPLPTRLTAAGPRSQSLAAMTLAGPALCRPPAGGEATCRVPAH